MYPFPMATIAAKYVIKTHYIMRVLEFHPETQTVDLAQDVGEFDFTPQGKDVVTNEFGVDLSVAVKPPAALEGVPVKQFRFGQFEIQVAPMPGDTGYIEVFTNDIRDWIQNGGFSVPWSDDHFLMQSAVFVPFVPNKQNCSKEYVPDDGSQLIIKSAHSKIMITDKPQEENAAQTVSTSIELSTPSASIKLSEESREGSEATVGLAVKADTMTVEASKGVSVKGDVSIDGNFTTTGTITADGDITSKNGDIVAGTISLKKHTHQVNYIGAGEGSTPQQTTSGAPQ